MSIAKRASKILFYGVPATEESGAVTYHRMTNFTEATTSKNPKEYTRQYVDESSERSDVVGYAPSTSYAFDLDPENPVHKDIVSITDGEKIGPEAVRELILVDLNSAAEGESGSATASAVARSYSVIPDGEGDGFDAYSYTGSFKANGEKQVGVASSSDGWQTVTLA